jgi:hypothetical protein
MLSCLRFLLLIDVFMFNCKLILPINVDRSAQYLFSTRLNLPFLPVSGMFIGSKSYFKIVSFHWLGRNFLTLHCAPLYVLIQSEGVGRKFTSLPQLYEQLCNTKIKYAAQGELIKSGRLYHRENNSWGLYHV